ncbi:hypothetical protein GYB22_06550 [bacterium]|nr:hypothetical protein [bacterium]
MGFRRKIKEYAEVPISRHLILDILGHYQRPNDKISELIKNNELISIRRGLYVVGPELDLPQPEPFLIANHLRGPSYVSLESAMSYWNMIPERVYEISSVTTKSSKTYRTELGRFTFRHLPIPYYSFGITSIEYNERQRALIASPEKAICDKIVLTAGVNLRSKVQTQAFLVEDMRIDEEVLSSLNTDQIALWIDNAPKSNSIEMLVKTLQTL